MDGITKESLSTRLGVAPDQLDNLLVARTGRTFDTLRNEYQSQKTGFIGDVKNKLKEGAYQALAAGQVFLGDVEGAAASTKKGMDVPKDPLLEQRIQGLSDDASALQTFKNVIKDPAAAAALLAQSTPGSLGSAAVAIPAGGVASAAVKGAAKPLAARLAGAATFGAGSYIQEYGNTVLSLLSEAGIDPTNATQMSAVLDDPDLGPKIRDVAQARGVPIGAFDAISYGLVGKGLGKGSLLGETAQQSAAGAMGEAGAQLASEGAITNQGDIAIEGILEAGSAIPQAVLQPVAERIFTGESTPSFGTRKDDGMPDAVIEEVPDSQETPSSPEAKANISGDERLINKANQPIPETISIPRPLLRGTPKQMTNRLMALPKDQLMENARKAGIPEQEISGSTKKVIADKLLAKYNIKGTSPTVQTASAPKATPAPKVERTSLSSNALRAAEVRAENQYVNKNKRVSGPITAKIDTPVQLPTTLLNDMAGAKGEEAFRDTGPKLKRIEKEVAKRGSFDISNKPIEVGINHRGEPYIVDGNHRVAYANKNGIPTLPTEVVYHAGGENKTYASLRPEALIGDKQNKSALPEQMANLDPNTRAALVETAKGEGRAAEGARAWLGMLDDNKEKVSKTSKALKTPVTPVAAEEVSASIEGLKNTTSKPSYRAAFNSVVNSIDKNVFQGADRSESDAVAEEMRSLLGESEGFDPTASKASRKKILSDIIQKDMDGKIDLSSYPRLKSYSDKVKAAVGEVTVESPRDPNAAAQEDIVTNITENQELGVFQYLDKLRDSYGQVLTTFVGDNPNYDITAEDYKKAANTSMLNRFFRSMDVFKSMPQVARELPFFAPMYQLYRQREAMKHTTSQYFLRNMQMMVSQYGNKRFTRGLEILDAMSRPGQKNGIQRVLPDKDGRITFRDFDGKLKKADKETSDIVLLMSEQFKQNLALQQQVLITQLQGYGIDPTTATRKDIADTLQKFENVGDTSAAEAIKTALEELDVREKLVRSDKAYFPHQRSEGPYGIALYAKDEDGKPKLSAFYSVMAKSNGEIDPENLKQVRQRIRDEAAMFGMDWTDRNGNGYEMAEPFYKTYDNMRSVLTKNANNPNLSYEVLSSLLTTKGIDPNIINQLFDDLKLKNNTAKMFTNLRQREGYFGYDNADRASSVVNYFMTQTSLLSSFYHNPMINRGFAKSQEVLARLPNTDKTRNLLSKYNDYMVNPAEDWASLRSASFWYFLALNPSTALLQFFSTYTNTLPWLSQYVGPVEFAKLNVKAVSNLFGIVRKIDTNSLLMNPKSVNEFAERAGIPVEDAKVLVSLKARGALDAGYAVEAVGDVELSRLGATPRNRRRTPGAVRRLEDLASNMITVPENMARINTAALVLEAIRDPNSFKEAGNKLYRGDRLFKAMVDGEYGGVITKEAIVRHAIDENHAVFGKAGRAHFMRGLFGTVMFPFLTYPIQIMEQIGRLLTSRGPRGVAAAGMMAIVYPALFGGLQSVSGYETWDWMTKWFNKLAKQKDTSLEIEVTTALKNLGVDENAARMIMSGPAFASLGIEASNRISNQFWFQPWVDFLMNPSDKFAQSGAADVFGGATALLNGWGQARELIAEGEGSVESLIKSMAPITIRNIAKSIDVYNYDYTTARGDRLLPKDPNASIYVKEDISNEAEALKQMLGFRSQLIAQASRDRYGKNMLDTAYDKQFSNYSSLLAKTKADIIRAKQSRDFEAVKDLSVKYADAMRELLAWNASLPEQERKTPKELLTRLKGLRERVMQDLDPLREKMGTGSRRVAAEDSATLANPLLVPYVRDR